jgi:cytoskeletal protein RodZ
VTEEKKKKKSSRKKEEKKEEVKVKKPEKKEEQKIMLDITWVAVLVLIAFFVGFLVRGYVVPAQTGISSPQLTPSPQMQQAPPLPPGVTTLPPGHPPIPGAGGEGETTPSPATSPTTETTK